MFDTALSKREAFLPFFLKYHFRLTHTAAVGLRNSKNVADKSYRASKVTLIRISLALILNNQPKWSWKKQTEETNKKNFRVLIQNVPPCFNAYCDWLLNSAREFWLAIVRILQATYTPRSYWSQAASVCKHMKVQHNKRLCSLRYVY